jgi:hypothetical protein
METQNLITTLADSGIGSSFKITSAINHTTKNYFVSTVWHASVSLFETIVKESAVQVSRYLHLPIVSSDSVEATMNHIALTRMCVTTDPAQWGEKIIDEFRPEKLKELLDSQMELPLNSSPLMNEYTHILLSMAGINYPPKRSPARLIIIVCVIAGIGYGSYKLFT